MTDTAAPPEPETPAAPALVETAAAPAPAEAPTADLPAPAQIEADAPADERHQMSANDKAFFRANIRWLMAELDWAKAGRTAEERAQLNP